MSVFCYKCKEQIVYLGALLSAVKFYGCQGCRRVWWLEMEEQESRLYMAMEEEK